MPCATPRETGVATATPAARSPAAASARLANGTTGSWSPCTSSTGGRAYLAGQPLRLEQPPREADDPRQRRRRRSPTCSAIIVPWLKPTSTVRSGRRRRGHGVEPAVEPARTPPTAEARATPRGCRRARGSETTGSPWVARAALRRVRRQEPGSRQVRRQRLGEPDQVVAVRAVAVQEDQHRNPIRRCTPGTPPRPSARRARTGRPASS